MKIIRLKSENVKRLVAVDITPNGNLVVIGGKNGAGKSSVLDSIAYALGGAALVPSEPIRTGQKEAKIEVDLGDYLVVRKFSRDRLSCDCIVSGNEAKPKQEGDAHAQNCAILDWGPTKSTLIVTNRDGAKYPTPQAILDKLLGKLTFDPLSFARATPKERDETLRRLVGLDFTTINLSEKAAYDRRTVLKKQLEVASVKLGLLPSFSQTPLEEVSTDVVSKEMLAAEEARKKVDEHQRNISVVEGAMTALTHKLENVTATIETYKQQLADAESRQQSLRGNLLENEEKLKAEQAKLEAAQAAVPDTAKIREKLSVIEETNRKVRANEAHRVAERERDELAHRVDSESHTINASVASKKATLEAAKFPVTGLSLNDDGVTFGGIPFEQASTSEQIRVSVAIGLALNPTLKVLLIRNGNALDDESLRLVGEQAATADAQVWMEYVSSDGEGIGVMIEEGLVVPAETEAT